MAEAAATMRKVVVAEAAGAAGEGEGEGEVEAGGATATWAAAAAAAAAAAVVVRTRVQTATWTTIYWQGPKLSPQRPEVPVASEASPVRTRSHSRQHTRIWTWISTVTEWPSPITTLRQRKVTAYMLFKPFNARAPVRHANEPPYAPTLRLAQ